MKQLPPDVVSGHQICLLDVELAYYVLVFCVLGVWSYFGANFLLKGVRGREGAAQAAYLRGFGTFVLLAVGLEALFVLDQYAEIYAGDPLFRRPADYGVDSVNFSDFFVLMPSVMAVCCALLIWPLEKYASGKPRPTIALFYLVLSPTPLVARFVEVNLERWTGVPVRTGTLPFFAMTGVWVFMVALALFAGVVVVGYYVRMARAAPPRSKLRGKCRNVVLGIVVWMLGLGTTMTARQLLWSSLLPGAWWGPLVVAWTPGTLLVALGLLASGFSREF
ncbi:MAG: hypothetical protein Kow0069_16350 [Promethearchaeota archaeon]